MVNPYKDRDWLYRKRYIENNDVNEIARTCGVHRNTINYYLRKLGISNPPRREVTARKKELICGQCGIKFDKYVSEYNRRKKCGVQTFYCTRECANISHSKRMSRENNPNFRGGYSGVAKVARRATDGWRRRVIEDSGGKCFITEEYTSDLDAHHVTPFYKIRDKVFLKLNIKPNSSISDYSNDELVSIHNLVKDLHEKEKGYAISRSLHVLFHQTYGYDVTEEDLLEFKSNLQMETGKEVAY